MTSREELEKKRDELSFARLEVYKNRVHGGIAEVNFDMGFDACLDLTYPEIEKLQKRVQELLTILKQINLMTWEERPKEIPDRIIGRIRQLSGVWRQALDEDKENE